MNKKTTRKRVLIKVQDLAKHYTMGSVVTKALKGISFEIYEGEFVGIMGPSGSGKSTALHQLGLLDYPTTGEIIIDGVNVNRLSEIDRSYFRLNKIGYVFQQYRNIPELTALENVYLPLRMLGKPRTYYLKEAKSLLEKVGLEGRLSHHPYELSGGEQQRVAMARALVHKPAILFADEPTANLDTDSGKVILELLKHFNKHFRQTIVMVSHEPEQIKYFDRVIRIRDGLLEKDTNIKFNKRDKL
ncbi:MAG: ABC transporter ATP-binding protein [Candidatus Aenigmarchaeota archaeon]|nr:ABC transporter ATP-binding protein [Candidatus Aenigmarchaeota archaeon]